MRYLIKQGYSPGQLVVLTPYLGQVRTLTEKLRLAGVCSVLVGDLDLDDMMSAGLSTFSVADTETAGTSGSTSIRISTIDNYQIKVKRQTWLSDRWCVGSNRKGILGHLQERQRVNVLLSRARDGLILVGNAQMLLNFRHRPNQMNWNKLMTILQKHRRIFDGLPIFCQQHPPAKLVCMTRTDFWTFAPDGGCTRLFAARR